MHRERQHQRIDISVGVVLWHEENRYPCLTRDLSLHGMSVASRNTWPVGTRLGVEILGDGAHIRTNAQVVSITDLALGLHFIDTNDELQSQISVLIAQALADHNAPRRVAAPGCAAGCCSATMRWQRQGQGDVDGPPPMKQVVSEISLDGAAIICSVLPEIGEEIIVCVEVALNDGGTQVVRSRAKVIRYTDRGFAMRFLAPNIAFRRVASRLRTEMRVSLSREMGPPLGQPHGPGGMSLRDWHEYACLDPMSR